jgi:hypothetical protein
MSEIPDLEKIRARAEAATPGPWECSRGGAMADPVVPEPPREIPSDLIEAAADVVRRRVAATQIEGWMRADARLVLEAALAFSDDSGRVVYLASELEQVGWLEPAVPDDYGDPVEPDEPDFMALTDDNREGIYEFDLNGERWVPVFRVEEQPPK